MKNSEKSKKLSIDKFTIAKLKNPNMITGGDGDDGTDGKDTQKKICVAQSSVYINPK
ncbi:hypothetical protein OO010_12615 [Flavobacteriaceae bacterium KMM 6898]|nr:hypothetical protein [Flavobacteriaceae bacterium KMM 6898]